MVQPGRAGGGVRARRRRWAVRLALGMGAALLVALAALGVAATWRPAWYLPRAVAHDSLRADKAALFELQDRISGALNAGRTVTERVSWEQLNRWLAARESFGPLQWPEGEAWREPVVAWRGGAVWIGVAVRGGGFTGIVSAGLRPTVAGDELQLTLAAARVGALPLPLGRVVRSVARQPMSADGTAVRLPTRFVWPNGKRPVRLTGMICDADGIEITLAPAR